MTQRLLMIEDDAPLAAMVGEYLEKSGMNVTHRASGRAGIAALDSGGFDAVILDLMLPDMDGLEVCRTIRAGSAVPILMLDTDRIVGLELGADDYLPKPFNPRELLARLRAILRRQGGAPTSSAATLRFGRLSIDRDARVVRVDDDERALTSHQFDLLWALAENAGRVMSRDQLMDHVRGHELEAFDRSIDVHISRIRAAIEDDPKRPRRVITIRGIGYVFARKQDGDA